MSTALLPIVLALTPLGVEPHAATSADEAWSRLANCGAGRDEVIDWGRVLGCHTAAREVLRLGDDADRERLWDRFAGEAEPLRPLLFTSLVESHVVDATRQLGDGPAPARPTLPQDPVEDLPKELETASPELKDAVRLFQRLMSRAWPESSVPEDERILYAGDGREPFQKLVEDFLRGRSDAAATRAGLERFDYGGGCGNGALEYFDALSAVRLVASIREGRIDADAAVAYVVGSSRVGNGRLGTDERLLEAAGIDWETLYVGGLVARGPALVQPLVRVGSGRAARLLLELAGLSEAPDESLRGYDLQLLAPMAAFVSTEGPCEGYETVSSDDFERAPDAPPIDSDVQQSILDALGRAVQPGAGLDEAQAASHALLRLCRAESRDAFSAMLRSPYAGLRERGAIALRALGETVADPAPSPPVAVRVMVDGRPWPSAVTWQVEGPGGFHGSGGTPDRDGVVRLERDPFVDPTVPVESVTLASEDLTSPDGTWFSVRFKPPADLDDRTLLTVRTGALTFVVPPSVRSSAPGQPEPLLLLYAGDEEVVMASLPVRAGRYLFPHLQHGTYRAAVLLPDGTMLESPDVEVGERPQTAALVPVVPADDAIDLQDREEVETPR